MNLQWLKVNALLFKRSAERCLEIRLLPNGKNEILFLPALVNYAFSTELYLKYLLMRNGSPAWGHKLLELFNSLDSAIRQEIISFTKYSNDEFESLLQKYSEGFIEWRYIHEQNAESYINIEFMRKLVDSVASIANRP